MNELLAAIAALGSNFELLPLRPQNPGGDAGAMRLTLVSIAISMVALLGSELLARRIGVRQMAA